MTTNIGFHSVPIIFSPIFSQYYRRSHVWVPSACGCHQQHLTDIRFSQLAICSPGCCWLGWFLPICDLLMARILSYNYLMDGHRWLWLLSTVMATFHFQQDPSDEKSWWNWFAALYYFFFLIRHHSYRQLSICPSVHPSLLTDIPLFFSASGKLHNFLAFQLFCICHLSTLLLWRFHRYSSVKLPSGKRRHFPLIFQQFSPLVFPPTKTAVSKLAL